VEQLEQCDFQLSVIDEKSDVYKQKHPTWIFLYIVGLWH